MTEETQRIVPINIEDEMRGAYIDYSMSVIISRALPDVRDGLKPVHRRVLYGMSELGVSYNRAHKKSARIVGEVLGKYHPHGDTSVYDTMVRMAQEWSLRYPLVDGQGNFGSVDGDSPAAMRYTEARLKRLADELLGDIDKNTVDFQPNFDDSLQEPSVLPAKLPNLLINGSSGIAVGMATNMAPHNLTEVINGIVAYLANPDVTVDELMEHITAPDFPTGGIIYGYEGVKQALRTGRGRVVVRAKATIETTATGREQIIVTEIPYMVNKASMIQKTAELVNDKKLEGISDLRDESDRDGMRIVYEIKRDAMASVVLNNLYKYTQLQSSFGVNNVALVKGRPLTLNLKDLIHHFVDHRQDVVIRRTQYELAEARKRAHILEGLLRALDYLEQVIELIRRSPDPDAARLSLMAFFEDKPFVRSKLAARIESAEASVPLMGLSDVQARAILDMRLQRLTGLERERLDAEYDELAKAITYYLNVLDDQALRNQIIRDELMDLRDRFGDARRTSIEYNADEIDYEDLIEETTMVVTISNAGYIKRTALAEYREQKRGGVGSRGVAAARDDDFTEHLFVASTHAYMLFFTELGRVFWKKVYELPEGGKTTKGRAIQNLIEIPAEDRVRAVIAVRDLKNPDYLENTYLVFCTEQGVIKKTTLEAYSRPRAAGIIAISINEGDRLLDVCLTNGSSDIVMALRSGRAIRFPETNVRPMGRNATGVRGIWLAGAGTTEDDTDLEAENGDATDADATIAGRDRVVGMVCIADPEKETLLVVSENGYGKRSPVSEYRTTKRGGKGIKTLNVTDKTGDLVAIKGVVETDDLMIINRSGITIRVSVAQLPVLGRATQGVRVIRLSDGDAISSVAHVAADDKEETDLEEAMPVGEGTEVDSVTDETVSIGQEGSATE